MFDPTPKPHGRPVELRSGIGTLAIVLHAHLPFVRHPEHEHFLEEDWLFEAVTESYLPLIAMLRRVEADGFGDVLALSVSPTLAHMLDDELLGKRTRRYLDERLRFAEREAVRTKQLPEEPLAQFYISRLSAMRSLLDKIGSVNAEFARLHKEGVIDLFTTGATHAILPLAATCKGAACAQVTEAVTSHCRHFGGLRPKGFWFPECAYAPGLEQLLAEHDLRWFILDAQGILHGNPRPRFAIFRHVFTPAGPAAFGRDRAASRQVWSAEIGYPGDPRYRDFYRDIGFDLPIQSLGSALPDGVRRFTGLKYHRVSFAGREKELYIRAEALQAAETHASHFVESRAEQFLEVREALPVDPVLVTPFDAELFGHWWFEGPEFLEGVIRRTNAPNGCLPFRLGTPSSFLKTHPSGQFIVPSASTWGHNGYLEVWINKRNAWIYPLIQRAMRRMRDAARQFAAEVTRDQERLLRQMGRELMLAQASDWAFLMRGDAARSYAETRTRGHLSAFDMLYVTLITGSDLPAEFEEIEARNNIFPQLNWRIFGA